MFFKKEECPCKTCLFIFGCRRKKYFQFDYCVSIKKYLGFEPRKNIRKHYRNFPNFYETLKPIYWSYRKWPKGHSQEKKDYCVNIIHKE